MVFLVVKILHLAWLRWKNSTCLALESSWKGQVIILHVNEPRPHVTSVELLVFMYVYIYIYLIIYLLIDLFFQIYIQIHMRIIPCHMYMCIYIYVCRYTYIYIFIPWFKKVWFSCVACIQKHASPCIFSGSRIQSSAVPKVHNSCLPGHLAMSMVCAQQWPLGGFSTDLFLTAPTIGTKEYRTGTLQKWCLLIFKSTSKAH